MNILYLLPGAGMSTDEIDRRTSIANSISRNDSNITVMEVGEGPISIESAIEEYMSIGPMLRKLVEIRKEKKYDALIIGCAGDPGLSPSRELLDIPVIGPAEASLHYACMISDRFSVLTVLTAGVESQDSVRVLVREKGLESRLASIEFVNIPVIDMWGKNKDKVINQMANGVLKAKENGAGCIILGCMSMAFLMVDDIVEKKTGLPIVNPLKISIKTAETFVDLKLKHSRITYPEADFAKLKSTIFN
ncbi:MAG: aspartate/glutamate racemase family protein [Candidatus Hodarchaeales archaeon]|jgi:allantoin racemase